MSLVASVAAIETLSNLPPIPANTPKTSRFKGFLKEFAGTGTELLASKPYKLRRDISHDGNLLREELFDGGFTLGGFVEQMLFPSDVTKATHIALVNWLISQQSWFALSLDSTSDKPYSYRPVAHLDGWAPLPPPIPRRRVPARQPGIPKNLLPQRAGRVLRLHQPPLLKNWHHTIYEVCEGAGGY